MSYFAGPRAEDVDEQAALPAAHGKRQVHPIAGMQRNHEGPGARRARRSSHARHVGAARAVHGDGVRPVLLVLNLPLIRIWIKILEIPRAALYTGILVFGTLGVYSLSNSFVDVMVKNIIGVLGFFMRRYGFPVGPTILGVILLPLAEAQFRRALSISQGNPAVFFTRPLSLGLLVAAAFAVVLPYVPAIIARLRHKDVPVERVVIGEGGVD